MSDTFGCARTCIGTEGRIEMTRYVYWTKEEQVRGTSTRMTSWGADFDSQVQAE